MISADNRNPRVGHQRRRKPFISLWLGALTLLALCASPHLAYAQVGGGGGGGLGGGGLGTAIVQYVITNFLASVLDVAVISVGIAMWFRHWHWGLGVLVAVGGLVATNYQTIAGYL